MEQTVIQIGNSDGIIFPKQLMKALNLKRGEKVVSEKADDDQGFVVRTTKRKKVKYTSSVTPEFLKILDGINKRYGPALAELARR